MASQIWGNKNNLLTELGKRVNQSCTPDFIDLKKKSPLQPVFVYGTLKRGNRLHDVISGCDYLGRGLTSIARWELRNAPHSSFPIMFKMDNNHPNRGKIWGEVYAVDPLTLLELDEIENNGRMYQRTKVHITLKDQTYKTTTGDKNPSIQIWTYLGVHKYWENDQCWRAPYVELDGTRIYDWQALTSWSEYVQTFTSDMDDDIPFSPAFGRTY